MPLTPTPSSSASSPAAPSVASSVVSSTASTKAASGPLSLLSRLIPFSPESRFALSSLTMKALLLLVVPLAVQLIFISVLWQFQNVVVRHSELTAHSKEVILMARSHFADISWGANRTLFGVLVDDKHLIDVGRDYLEKAIQGFTRLAPTVSDNPAQFDMATKIIESSRAYVSNTLIFGEKFKGLPPPEDENRREAVRSFIPILESIVGDGLRLRTQIDQFIATEEHLELRRNDLLQKSLKRTFTMLAVGTFMAILVSVLLLQFFQSAFHRRIKSLLKNVQGIGEARTLSEKVGGNDELTRIEEALNGLNELLREKDFETELFIYSVSHDLRSPLVNLSGFSDELGFAAKEIQSTLSNANLPAEIQAKTTRLIDDDITKALSFIRQSTKRMSRIIDALLRLSRAGRVTPSENTVDLDSLVPRLVDSLGQSIEQKHAKIHLGKLPVVLAEASALEQIFQNLLTNALKYSSPDRVPEIAIEVVDTTVPGFSTIAVKDNGLGISKDAQSKLFMAFQRLHPDVVEGDGIGLALVRRLANRLGGRVWCESTPGKGSEFYVSLRTPNAPDSPAAQA